MMDKTGAEDATPNDVYGWRCAQIVGMDLHNNQLGREIGKNTATRDLEEAVLRSITEGKAAILVNGKSMLHTP